MLFGHHWENVMLNESEKDSTLWNQGGMNINDVQALTFILITTLT